MPLSPMSLQPGKPTGADAFLAQFGAPIDQLQILIAQKTVTISRLMEIAPPGTTNPTSGLNNSTMVLMASLLAIALISNALMRPVHARHHIVDTSA